MVSCVHHIPGRARFKIEALRANASLADSIHSDISNASGVKFVETNLHAGSVVVHYCTETARMSDVYELICGHCPLAFTARGDNHFADNSTSRLSRPQTTVGSDALRDAVSRAVVNTLINRALEMSMSQLAVRSR